MVRTVPVIDIFAGPGGLSEGFSQIRDSLGNQVFDICLSVEKEEFAHKTLLLRAFFRKLVLDHDSLGLEDYYALLRGVISIESLYAKHPETLSSALKTVWKAELGSDMVPQGKVRNRINVSLGSKRRFVLIGGPPCQAYSLAGRSRNKGNIDYDPIKDRRQLLYKEYLKILADHCPVVFVMENVKGLLSAKLKGEHVLKLIIEDLQNPAKAVYPKQQRVENNRSKYRLFSFSADPQQSIFNSKNFIIKAENHGIPQSRHRLIILGIRGDYERVSPKLLKSWEPVAMNKVISDLPKIRSGLSKTNDSIQNWVNSLEKVSSAVWYLELKMRAPDIARKITETISGIKSLEIDRGGMFVRGQSGVIHYLPDWFKDNHLYGVCNHEARSHIPEDLHRYLFASCFAMVRGRSPDLKDFPRQLLPKHKNLRSLKEGSLGEPIFIDRFRVQIADRPATTITSHIAKDGHYYIHPDPMQCRSLTVREAARIQTFPDNYLFCGPRTSQYQQVGNAVPPYLAYQLAEIVHDLLKQMSIT